MPEKFLMKGNEALAEAAIRAGCRYFFGYPITPQNEIPEYMAKHLPEVGGVYVQAESEVAAINMVYGAAGAGARVMTSSSSPGISLKQEGISYLAGAELPCVIVNMVRGGPGLGGIQPAQSDYFQATRGGGHGDYRLIVLGPDSVQEIVDITFLSFELADKYRIPVLILGDGLLGQMMEPVEFPDISVEKPAKPWATTGMKDRPQNIIKSLHLDPLELERHNLKLQKKYSEISDNEQRMELFMCEDADLFIVAYGTTARIAKSVVVRAREEGIAAGLIRPISLWPFPNKAFEKIIDRAKVFLTLEMSCGQMIEDVKLTVNGRVPVVFYGRTGGIVPKFRDVLEKLRQLDRSDWHG